jgi:hypothetical protein
LADAVELPILAQNVRAIILIALAHDNSAVGGHNILPQPDGTNLMQALYSLENGAQFDSKCGHQNKSIQMYTYFAKAVGTCQVTCPTGERHFIQISQSTSQSWVAAC